MHTPPNNPGDIIEVDGPVVGKNIQFFQYPIRTDHTIELAPDEKTILRDSKVVDIIKLDEKTIKLGCTIVKIKVIHRLLELINDSKVLQTGDI